MVLLFACFFFNVFIWEGQRVELARLELDIQTRLAPMPSASHKVNHYSRIPNISLKSIIHVYLMYILWGGRDVYLMCILLVGGDDDKVLTMWFPYCLCFLSSGIRGVNHSSGFWVLNNLNKKFNGTNNLGCDVFVGRDSMELVHRTSSWDILSYPSRISVKKYIWRTR